MTVIMLLKLLAHNIYLVFRVNGEIKTHLEENMNTFRISIEMSITTPKNNTFFSPVLQTFYEIRL